MSISIGPNYNLNNQFQQTAKTRENINRATSFAEALSKSQEASANPGTAKSSGKLDFTNMTPRTMFETMNKFIREGKMTLDESTAIMGMIPTPLSKVNYDGNMPESYDQPWNFFAKIQEGIKGALSRNEKASADSLQQTYDILMRHQS